jgi:DNA-directed RNA polymerase specialized sigma24 family protein
MSDDDQMSEAEMKEFIETLARGADVVSKQVRKRVMSKMSAGELAAALSPAAKKAVTDDYLAGLTPEETAELLKQLQGGS